MPDSAEINSKIYQSVAHFSQIWAILNNYLHKGMYFGVAI